MNVVIDGFDQVFIYSVTAYMLYIYIYIYGNLCVSDI